MLRHIKAWRANERRKKAAAQRAVEHFKATRGVTPMGAHVLRIEPDAIIVRVMYMTDHIPPDRAWFSISADLLSVRELSYADVESVETPWR